MTEEEENKSGNEGKKEEEGVIGDTNGLLVGKGRR